MAQVLLVYLTLFLLIVVPISFWTDRSLDYVFTLLKHHTVDVPYWLSLITTLVGNGFIFLFNVIVEIYRHVV